MRILPGLELLILDDIRRTDQESMLESATDVRVAE
jgi:hypothetical protein